MSHLPMESCCSEKPVRSSALMVKKNELSLFLAQFLSSGNRILDVIVSKDQMYPLKLKGISICFSMLKAALCGSYVNFGVFRFVICKLIPQLKFMRRLYGDEALDNALNTFVKLLLSIPQTDLLVIYCVRKVIRFCILCFRTTQSFLRLTMFCWNVWPRTTWHFWLLWSLK